MKALNLDKRKELETMSEQHEVVDLKEEGQTTSLMHINELHQMVIISVHQQGLNTCASRMMMAYKQSMGVKVAKES